MNRIPGALCICTISFFLAAVLALAGPLTGCTHRLAHLDMSDSGIRARVLAELKGHPELNLRYMQINVHMRVAYLSCMVESEQMKNEIAKVVRRIPGVRHVIVNLLISDCVRGEATGPRAGAATEI